MSTEDESSTTLNEAQADLPEVRNGGNDADSIQVHFYTVYPGSAAWEKYKHQIGKYEPAQMFHYSSPSFTLAAVSPGELETLRSQFYRRYLFRPGFALKHLWRHGAFYLHNPDILWRLLGIRKIF